MVDQSGGHRSVDVTIFNIVFVLRVNDAPDLEPKVKEIAGIKALNVLSLLQNFKVRRFRLGLFVLHETMGDQKATLEIEDRFTDGAANGSAGRDVQDVSDRASGLGIKWKPAAQSCAGVTGVTRGAASRGRESGGCPTWRVFASGGAEPHVVFQSRSNQDVVSIVEQLGSLLNRQCFNALLFFHPESEALPGRQILVRGIVRINHAALNAGGRSVESLGHGEQNSADDKKCACGADVFVHTLPHCNSSASLSVSI